MSSHFQTIFVYYLSKKSIHGLNHFIILFGGTRPFTQHKPPGLVRGTSPEAEYLALVRTIPPTWLTWLSTEVPTRVRYKHAVHTARVGETISSGSANSHIEPIDVQVPSRLTTLTMDFYHYVYRPSIVPLIFIVFYLSKTSHFSNHHILRHD